MTVSEVIEGSVPLQELEFEEGDFEEIEIDKDDPNGDTEDDLDLEEGEGDDDFTIVNDDDDFVEATETWGSTLEDRSTARFAAGKEIMSIAIRPCEPFIVALGGMDDRVTLCDPNTMAPLQVLDFEETVNVLEWSSDGSSLAVGTLSGESVPGRVYIYSFVESTPTLMHTIDGPGDDVEWLSWHPKGPCIMGGFADGTVWVWMTNTGNLYNVLVGHGAAVTCGQFVEGGKKAVTASADGGVIVWSLNTASIDFHLRPNAQFFGTSDIDYSGGHSNAVICISCHPSLPLVASGSEDNTVKIFNWETQRVVKTISGFADTIETLSWFPGPPDSDHLILAGASLDGSLMCWNGNLDWRVVLKGRHALPEGVTSTNEHPEGGITRLRWIVPPSNLPVPEQVRSYAKIATISLDGTMRLWSFAAEHPLLDVFGGSNAALVTLTHRIDSAGCVQIYCAGDDGIARLYTLC